MNPTGPSLRFGGRQPRALLAVRLFSPGVFPSRPDMGSRLEEMPVAAAAFSLPQPLTHRRSLVTGGGGILVSASVAGRHEPLICLRH